MKKIILPIALAACALAAQFAPAAPPASAVPDASSPARDGAVIEIPLEGKPPKYAVIPTDDQTLAGVLICDAPQELRHLAGVALTRRVQPIHGITST
jgi:hypothetical protein